MFGSKSVLGRFQKPTRPDGKLKKNDTIPRKNRESLSDKLYVNIRLHQMEIEARKRAQ